jgi:FtsH-binding integral membrane protein
MNWNQPEPMTTNRAETAEFDEGLRAYMLGVYNYMASALIVTGLVAYFVFSMAVAGTAEGGVMVTELGNALLNTPLKWVMMFAPLGVVFYLGARMHAMTPSAAKGWFWAYSVLMGVSLFTIFLAFSGTSIARVFFITAGTFGAMSLYGYTTKRDLTGMGSFLIMGVIGLIIASVVNIFLQSSALQFGLSIIGVLLFVGLTAYDTQKIKNTYYMVAGNAEAAAKASVMGALSLYLDFINLFIMLLNLFGNRD